MTRRKTLAALTMLSIVLNTASGQAVLDRPAGVTRQAKTELPTAQAEDVDMSSEKLAMVMPVLQKFVDDKKVPHAIVCVARRGKIVLLDSVGWSKIEAQKPIRNDAVLRFYSMSKPITSVAIMMLVEEGKIALDEPVTKHVPEFEGLKVFVKNDADDIELAETERAMTVRDLLRHTSGLTYGFFGDTPVDKMYGVAKVMSKQDTVSDTVAKLSKLPLLYQPGTRFNYSVSTDLLGYIVQQVSGKRLDEFFQQRVFEPLAMQDTAFHVAESKADRLVSNYSPKADGSGLRVIDAWPWSPYLKPPKLYSGGGGLVSTVRDYIRFCQMLLNKGELNGVRLLEAATVEQMTRNQLPDVAYPISLSGRRDGVGFGLGFSVIVEETKYTKSSPIGEYGWGGAASTHFWISPKDDLAVVVLTQHMPFSFLLEDAVKPLIYDAIVR